MYALTCWLEVREVTACCWVLVPRYIKKSLMVVTSYGFSHSPLTHGCESAYPASFSHPSSIKR